MRIEVTQKDIDHGSQNSRRFCPIAIAARRVTPVGVSVSVWPPDIQIEGPGRMDPIRRAALPDEAEQWIVAYDTGCGTPRPFNFEVGLEVPA